MFFDDADIEAVVEGVRTFGYCNAGQDCTAACRIYAQKGIYDTLVEKLGAAVATLKSGAPDDESTELGPFSSLAHLERVSKAVEEAKATGHIKVITGGEKRKGNERLLCADAAGWRIAGRCHRAKRGIWSGSECYALRQRRTGGELGEWQPVRTCIFGMDERCGQGRIASARGCNMVVPGSIPISCW